MSFAYKDVGEGREQDAVSFAYKDVGEGREQDAVSFAYKDVGEGREQDAVSFAYKDVGEGREQDAVSFAPRYLVPAIPPRRTLPGTKHEHSEDLNLNRYGYVLADGAAHCSHASWYCR